MLHHRPGTSARLSLGRKEVYPIMDKKESLLRQKAKAEKEAAQYENQVKILLNKQRDAERHARNHRLIVHGALIHRSGVVRPAGGCCVVRTRWGLPPPNP